MFIYHIGRFKGAGQERPTPGSKFFPFSYSFRQKICKIILYHFGSWCPSPGKSATDNETLFDTSGGSRIWQRGCANPRGVHQPVIFPRKLHKTGKKIGTRRGHVTSAPLPTPASANDLRRAIWSCVHLFGGAYCLYL